MRRRLPAIAGLALAAGIGGLWWFAPARAPAAFNRWAEDLTGVNRAPLALVRPPDRPLSLLAQVGKRMFLDPSLSASGRQSCASCHRPDRDYGPPPDGGIVADGRAASLRATPSLAYLYRHEVFGIGPPGDDDAPAVPVAGAAPPVPRGGLFWDGRADTLMAQATGPLTDPAEMANPDAHAVARRLARAGYPALLAPLFGAGVLRDPDMLFAEGMSALSRYQIEAGAFHRFDSRYDLWLEGRARLSRAEMRGLRAFEDPARGNCAACHVSRPKGDGLPPLFTDGEYAALGVPRNRRLAANRDPRFFDLGLCGPRRTDLRSAARWCGMFRTPTLRNAARRSVFFHNGAYRTLARAIDFYNRRATDPARIYPRDASGRVRAYDDLPARYRANVSTEAPFDRRPGQAPPLTEAEVADMVAFLQTLNDGARRSR